MKNILTLVLVSLFVTGCGGGGGGGSGDVVSTDGNNDNGGDGGASSLTISSTPTAEFSGSQANADALVEEIQDDVPDLVELTSTNSLPGAINTLPGGVATTIECSSLYGSGSGTVTTDNNFSNDGVIVGKTYTVTYSSCAYSFSGWTYIFDGSLTSTYTRYNSATDFAISVTSSNFMVSLTSESYNYSYGPLNITYNLDYANGTFSYSYTVSNGGASDISSSNVTRNGNDVTITSATYVYDSTSTGGVIKVVFSNWTYNTTTSRPVSGSITVTGANGNTVKIDATGAGYTVTYTINGTVTSYTVNF
jgi:hypothetical protein